MARFALYAGAMGLLAALVLLVVSGPLTGVVAVGLSAFLLAIACFGPERVGFAMLGLTFFTAPFYKGLESSVGTSAVANLLFIGAVVLLFPRMLKGRTHAAAPFFVGFLLITVTGVAASAISVDPAQSLIALVQWLLFIGALPLVMVSLGLRATVVNRLAWMFVIGHMVSILYGLAMGPVGDGGRYDGLTQHPNAFAQSGLITFALLLHLLVASRHRWIVYGAMVASLMSIYLSGSRGGTAAVACIILLIPVVERSAFVGYALAFAGTIAFVAVQELAIRSSAGGSFARLLGGGSSAGSDAIRSQSLHDAFVRFGHHPLLGNGLLDLFWIHNNYVEVAVSIGSLGLIGFLVLLFSFGRGLFGRSELRRLCYPVAAYAVFGATIPSLTDRSIWLAISLSFALFRGFWVPPEDATEVLPRPRAADAPAEPSVRFVSPSLQPVGALRSGDRRPRSH